MWTAAEDYILDSWLSYIGEHPLGHVSLHFDGVRLSKSLPCDVSSFASGALNAFPGTPASQ